jgi:hypothetical protein
MKGELRELVGQLRENGQVTKVVSDIEKRVQKDTAKSGDASSRTYVPSLQSTVIERY